jgi:RNA polymerase sigma-70 factor, ECF subfamily
LPGLKLEQRTFPIPGMTDSLDQVRKSLIGLLPRLRRFARTITRNHDEADDLVESAVELALQRYEASQAESRFEVWMLGIVRSIWVDQDHLPRSRHSSFAPAADRESGTDGPDDSEAETLAIHNALWDLPEEQRMTVALVLIENLSYADAADALDVSIDTMTSRLARGREALLALL